MDTSDYLPMFLAECREHLLGLNLALVRIEQNRADRESVDEVFRIAHSLKGMSATMGFSRMASLTHEMENVLELLRKDEGGLPPDAADVLFSCLDALGQLTDEIEETGAETGDPTGLESALRALVGSAAADPATAARAAVLRRVQLTVAADCDMPAVRAYLACQALASAGEIVESTPPLEAIERGEIVPSTIVVLLSTQLEDVALRALARTAEGIHEVVVGDPEAVPAAGGERSPQGLAGAQAHPNRRQTIRIDAERLDGLLHLMGEMVVQRTRLEALAAASKDPALVGAVADLTRVSQALQGMIMQVRMVPVESVFMRFPRTVRDLASKLDKQVELVIHGEETELDRTVVEALGDPLVHLVRNALDHGIESPEERVAAGKPAAGTLRLSARHAGGDVIISVQDDGAGVDPANVAAVAVRRGLMRASQVDELTVEEAVELLFAPGFTTAAVTTDVSGRGVGMDVVRAAVRNLGGDLTMTSEPGVGTRAQLRLPITLAILPALVVEVDGAPFALPLDRVEQAIRVSDHTLRSVKGQHAITLRDRVLPLYDLGRCLGCEEVVDPESASVVVVRSRDRSLGLMVRRLVGQQELVTRPLPAVVDGGYSAVSGGAVLGDGQIALIVDCDRLVGKAA
jgi:two-component system chemotaxis sensor kinase CheA